MFDSDHTGLINIEEFDKLYNYVTQWLGVFHTYDRDQSGHIEEAELTHGFYFFDLLYRFIFPILRY